MSFVVHTPSIHRSISIERCYLEPIYCDRKLAIYLLLCQYSSNNEGANERTSE